MMRRTHLKPPDGERCDTMKVVDGKPTRCEKRATVELVGQLPFETWVCEPCAKILLAKHGKVD